MKRQKKKCFGFFFVEAVKAWKLQINVPSFYFPGKSPSATAHKVQALSSTEGCILRSHK